MARVRALDRYYNCSETETTVCNLPDDNHLRLHAGFSGLDALAVPQQEPRLPQHEVTITNLPEELYVRIFRYLDPIQDRLPVLALVCRKWREVLLNSGSLWRYIHVDPAHYGFWHLSLLCSLFRLYGHHIQSLSWRNNSPVYESVFALIPRLTSLKSLHLPILWTPAVVETLAPLSQLQQIDVNGGFSITDCELEMIAQFFPDLRKVSLNACWAVTASGVERLLSSLPFLESLKLKINSGLRMNDFRSEAAMMMGSQIIQTLAESVHAKVVNVLCIHFVPIEMDQLWEVVNCLNNLKKLSVSNCENLHAIRLNSTSLQKVYLFNLWSVLFVSINAANLRLLTIDYGLESMEHLEVFAPRLRKLVVDGSDVLRTLHIRCDRLVILELSHCEDLDTRSLKDALANNTSIACLRLGKVSPENLNLDEQTCPSIKELCLLGDFACNTLHIRSPTLRLIHTKSEGDLQSLSHMYVIANHLCKVTLVGVPALRSLAIQCVSVDAIELNLCSDDQICLESCVIQALASIGFLRLFDCKVDLFAVVTPVARTIVLYRCQMSNYVLQMALTGCPNIAHLNLEKCRNLTSVNVSESPMKYLNLFGCADMHRVDLDCPKLVALNLGHCPDVRLFIKGIEQDLCCKPEHLEIVLPSQSMRWSHDYPPEVYMCD